MAANGFIELLRLSKRGNKNYASVQNEAQRWSGIAFEMRGQYFVAPLGEVSEVIYPPKYTPVPNTQSWVKGLANIRGRLLSVSDLAHFISGQRSSFSSTQKCCVLAIMTSMWGWLWIRFWGFSTLIKSFSQSSDLEENLKEYCQGYFHQHNQHWHVFYLVGYCKTHIT